MTIQLLPGALFTQPSIKMQVEIVFSEQTTTRLRSLDLEIRAPEK